MKILDGINSLIDWEMATPKPYGLFHLIAFGLVIIIVFLMYKYLKTNPEVKIRKIIIYFIIMTVGFEIMKQGLFTYEAQDYQWYAFPFQFCSTPMYIALLSVIVKKGKVQNALYSFLGFYGLFAGLIVMISPGDVFTYLVMINIQTMVHHGALAILGFSMVFAKKAKFDFKSFLNATLIFIILVFIALILNIIAHYTIEDTFNMFFISPFGVNHLPILSEIQMTQPYLIFLFAYIFGFSLAIFLIQKIFYGIALTYHKYQSLN